MEPFRFANAGIPVGPSAGAREDCYGRAFVHMSFTRASLYRISFKTSAIPDTEGFRSIAEEALPDRSVDR